MASKLTIRKAEMADLYALAETLREADRLEVERGTHDSALDALIHGRESGPCFAARYDGKLLCVFGLSYIEPEVAGPWLLATDELQRHSVTLMRAARLFVKVWSSTYFLVNQVDSENAHAIRFLRALGFQFCDEPASGKDGHPFLVFFMEKRHV